MSPKPPRTTERERTGRLARALQIGRVLRHYGFAWFLHESGLGDWVPGRLKRGGEIGLAAPVAFRRALEELGPTAVKLGQALATRGDVLPPDWVAQLRALQDRVPPVGPVEVRKVVEEELGRPLEESFPTFSEESVASASIGQVHLARLASGAQVAVKVQRPTVARQIDADLGLLLYGARMAEGRYAWLAEQRVTELIGEFARNLRGELDFALEAHNTRLLAGLLKDDPRVAVPHVHDGFSTGRVLTVDWIDGHKPSETEALDAAGLDRPTIARNLAGVMLRLILRDGCFHADPHGGNVLVGRDGRLYLLDCGNVAFVPPHLQDDLVYLLVALLDGNADDVADQIAAIGLTTEKTDHTSFRADANRLVVGFHSLSTADMRIGDVLDELLRLLFHHHVVMPPVFSHVLRALILTEAECRNLDPRFDFREVARTVVHDTLRRLARPRRAAMELLRLGRSLQHHALALPKQLLLLMRKAEAGGLKVRFEPEGLEQPLHRLDAMFNRLAFSIVVAAMILAPALWLQVNVGGGWPLWHPATFFLAIGFALGLWLLWSIIRSGRLQ